MYVLALSDYKQPAAAAGYKPAPQLGSLPTQYIIGRRKQLLLQFVNIDDFVDNSINGEPCN